MKASIITYHRAYNYGSALQAYALNCYLSKYCDSVETIDYRTDRQDNLYVLFEKKLSVMSLARNIHTLMFCKKLSAHKKKFDDFLRDYLPMTSACRTSGELKELNKKYDFFICGSDQIWNPVTADFDSSYLLDFVDDKKKCVSYAPSVGIDNIPEQCEEIFKSCLKDYLSLSTREKSGSDLIEKLTERDVETVLDPVFLLDESEWKNVSSGVTPLSGKYILGYFIGDVAGMRAFAENVQKKYNLPVVVINKNLRDFKYPVTKLYDSGPEEFLSLIENAELIVTDSFHAVAFSLIFGKKFWVFENTDGRISSKSRIYNILEIADLKSHILNAGNMDAADPLENIDYRKVKDSLSGEIKKSKLFLHNALGI